MNLQSLNSNLSGLKYFLFGLMMMFLFPQKVQARDNQCYFVAGAGVAAVNGVYFLAGEQNGRPIYQHESDEYYLVFDAFSFGGEWNLTDSLNGGQDLYFIQTSSMEIPTGDWMHGLRGLYPGFRLLAVDCYATGPITTLHTLAAGTRIDAENGKMGLFSPESFTSGWMRLTKMPFDVLPARHSFSPQSKGLQVEFTTEDGKPIENYRGLNYVFFNLTRQTRNFWWQDELKVYFYDGQSWQSIDAFYVRSKWPGRIAILVTKPGFYILGSP